VPTEKQRETLKGYPGYVILGATLFYGFYACAAGDPCPGGDRHQSIQYLDWDLVEWAGAIAPYVSCGRDLRADVASAS